MLEYNLIILDDDRHTHQYFLSAIKTVFPSLPDKAAQSMCTLIHKAGSATCARGCLERLELSKESLERFSLKCEIERRII